LSRTGECIFCLQKFDEKTLFSCPRCGALVARSDEKCPGCNAPLSDSGIAPGTMTDKEADELLSELEELSREIAEKVESGMTEMSAAEKERIDHLVKKMLEVQVIGAEELGVRDIFPVAEREEEPLKIQPLIKKVGRVNGLAAPKKERMPGMVNGMKPSKPMESRPPLSWMQGKIVGKLLVWQLIAIILVAALLLSSLLAVFYLGVQSEEISIDGEFSDWDSVPSYSFSSLLPELDLEVAEAKLSISEDSLLIYLRLDNSLFTGTDPSTLYAFVDTDADSDTGYSVNSHLGAESLGMLAGWEGDVKSSARSEYVSETDRSNWSAWSTRGELFSAQVGREIELSLHLGSSSSTETPIVQLVTVIEGVERCTPALSLSGTILAVQRALIDDEVAATASPPVLNVSLIVLGVDDEKFTVQSSLLNDVGEESTVGPMVASSTHWTAIDISADLSMLQDGESFTYGLSIASDDFSGSLQVIGEPARGYYLSMPDQISIDGLFSDWDGRKSTDADPEPLENPNIDIQEYGAATEAGNHFFFLSVAGTALDGADVPEQRSKTIPQGPPSPVVRLRKTGEDLLQAFIDRDPGNETGRLIQAGDISICADLLIEIYGRDGIVTSKSVEEWSAISLSWGAKGDIDEIATGSHGVEFSVSKVLLGNLTGSEIIFYITDWKARSDHSWIGAALADPWVILEDGDDYRSSDGINWVLNGTISLETGDRVVDFVISPSREYVFAITNTGRSYRWWVGQSSTWGSVTDAITGTTDVIAIAMCSNGDGFSMTADGRLFNKTEMTPINLDRDWNFVSQIAGSYTDFCDIVWRSGNTHASAQLYALRSTQNTALNRTNDGGSSWSQVGSLTGSSNTQTQMVVIAGASDKLYVLEEDGNIRNSSDSGASWSSIGDLPQPGGGNSSVYCGIAIDVFSNIWVITDTGYCYKSSNDGNNFIYTGRPASLNVVSITAPIPEFSALLFPILTSLVVLMAIRFRALNRGRKERD